MEIPNMMGKIKFMFQPPPTSPYVQGPNLLAKSIRQSFARKSAVALRLIPNGRVARRKADKKQLGWNYPAW